ncbi:MAG: lysyl oxidase family protein [Solirubrobacteraceae bacterium]|nr:lysyl oxidase family protein [Patulibacter sp.]
MRRVPSALVLFVAAVLGLGALTAGAALAIVPLPPHPWLKPSVPHTQPAAHVGAEECQQPGVKCPDLAMRPPYQLTPDVEEGHHVLRAANAVLSIGTGPVEIRASRAGRKGLSMHAVQYVHRAGKPALRVPGDAGKVVYKRIPGQGRIWKFQNAARFELWTTGGSPRLVRIGEKLTYCLRDLRHLWSWRRSPKNAHYPACSHSARIRNVTLGTSPGWTDIYPATYYDQWINVDGLRGCFELVHVADPDNEIVESDETNNAAATRVRLPMGKRTVARC